MAQDSTDIRVGITRSPLEAANPLDQVTVASPCPASWEKMIGNAQVRFCRHCEKNVYNLSEMSRSEAEALVQRREGRVCVRIYQRADGKMLTQDCPVGLRTLRRASFKLAIGLATMFTVLVGVVSLAFATSSRNHGPRSVPSNPFQIISSWFNPPTTKFTRVSQGAIYCPPQKQPPPDNQGEPKNDAGRPAE